MPKSGPNLNPPDVHYLNAAQGWLELGNPKEAAAEIEMICPTLSNHPDVLNARCHILGQSKRWSEACDVASKQVELWPDDPQGWINRSNALHYQGEYAKAAELLQPAFERFSKCDIIPYNMACHLARLSQLNEARRWLARAVKRSSAKIIRERALNDPDLECLWAEIAAQW